MHQQNDSFFWFVNVLGYKSKGIYFYYGIFEELKQKPKSFVVVMCGLRCWSKSKRIYSKIKLMHGRLLFSTQLHIPIISNVQV